MPISFQAAKKYTADLCNRIFSKLIIERNNTGAFRKGLIFPQRRRFNIWKIQIELFVEN
jgi:hypothetical protein